MDFKGIFLLNNKTEMQFENKRRERIIQNIDAPDCPNSWSKPKCWTRDENQSVKHGAERLQQTSGEENTMKSTARNVEQEKQKPGSYEGSNYQTKSSWGH